MRTADREGREGAAKDAKEQPLKDGNQFSSCRLLSHFSDFFASFA
jgi:hypothetical protein